MLNYGVWIEIQPNNEVLTRIQARDPVLQRGRRIRMNARERVVDRSIKRQPGYVTGGGSRPADYGTASGVGDKTRLTLEKTGLRVQLLEDDIRDMDADVLRTEVTEIGVGTSQQFVRATLCADGGSKESIGRLSTKCPYNSAFSVSDLRWKLRVLMEVLRLRMSRQADNLIHLDYFTDVSYDDIIRLADAVESSEYTSAERLAWICDIRFRYIFRSIVDDNGNPIFVDAREGSLPTLLGNPVEFVHGMTIGAQGYPAYSLYDWFCGSCGYTWCGWSVLLQDWTDVHWYY